MSLIDYDGLIPTYAAYSYNTPMDMIEHFNLMDPLMVRYMADLYTALTIKVDIGTSISPTWKCKLKNTVICSCRKKPPSDLFTMLKELNQLNSKGKVMMSVVLNYMIFKYKISNLNQTCCTDFHYNHMQLFNFYWKDISPVPDLDLPTIGIWSTSSPIVIPFKNHVHLSIDWGDGILIGYNSNKEVKSPDLAPGNHTVKIYPHKGTSFSFNYYSFKNSEYRKQLKNIQQWGLTIIDSQCFYMCEELNSILGTDLPNIVSGNSIFYGCKKLEIINNINNWDMSKVNTLKSMFEGCETLTSLSINNWDTNNVLYMTNMFKNCNKLDIGLSIPIKNVSSMIDMFQNTNLTHEHFDNFLIFCEQYAKQYGVKNNVSLTNSPSYPYSEAAISAYQYLTTTFNWTITPPPPENNTWYKGMFRADTNGEIELGVYNDKKSFIINWGSSTQNYNPQTVEEGKIKKGGFVPNSENLIQIHGDNFYFVFTDLNISNNFSEIKNWGGLKLTGNDFQDSILTTITATDSPNISSIENTFNNCINLINVDFSHLDLKNVTSISGILNGCTHFDQDINNWDVLSIKNMNSSFKNCTTFNKPLWTTETQNVTTMNNMFQNATIFNQDISNLNISNVKNMSSMFSGASALSQNNFDKFLSHCSKTTNETNVKLTNNPVAPHSTEAITDYNNLTNALYWTITPAPPDNPQHSSDATIGTWAVSDSKTTIIFNNDYMEHVWVDWGSEIHSYSLTDNPVITRSGLSGTDVEMKIYPQINKKVTFGIYGASDINNVINISKWGDYEFKGDDFSTYPNNLKMITATDTPKITSLSSSFYGCINLTNISNINNWDTQAVTKMDETFRRCENFNADLSNWNTENVTNMELMFQSTNKFNCDISKWNVSKVTTMEHMFLEANGFQQDLSQWVISNVSDMTDMFLQSNLNQTNFDKTLTGWGNLAPNVQSDVSFTGNPVAPHSTDAIAAYYTLVSDYGWTITPAPPVNPQYSSDATIGTWAVSDSKTTIVFNDDMEHVWINWGTGIHSYSLLNADFITKSGLSGSEVEVEIYPGINDTVSFKGSQHVKNISQWGAYEFRGLDFDNCYYLEQITATDIPKITSLNSSFNACNSLLTINNINNWDVSNVTEMTTMFTNAKAFNGDLSSWDVSNVTEMTTMFTNAKAFNGDINNWDVSKVTSMDSMFTNATAFTGGDLSSWDVSNVTDMVSMFAGATAFNGDISNWTVSSVTNMNFMFFQAISFNKDLSWDVKNVTDMKEMFYESGLNQTNFDKTLTGWGNLVPNVQSDVSFTGNPVAPYSTDAIAAYNKLVYNHGWTITPVPQQTFTISNLVDPDGDGAGFLLAPQAGDCDPFPYDDNVTPVISNPIKLWPSLFFTPVYLFGIDTSTSDSTLEMLLMCLSPIEMPTTYIELKISKIEIINKTTLNEHNFYGSDLIYKKGSDNPNLAYLTWVTDLQFNTSDSYDVIFYYA